MLAGNQLGQIPLPLRIGAVELQLIDAEIRMRAIRQPNRRACARNFFHGNAMLEVAEACAAIFLLDRNSMQAERSHLRPEIARKDIVAIDRVRTRRNPVLREAADLLAQHVDISTEAEVEGKL